MNAIKLSDVITTLPIKKLNDAAIIPPKGSSHSAGYDLYSIENYTLKPLERKLFKTGLSLAIPQGMYGRIAPRSGLAFKNGIDVMAGVIDEDYRGELGVVLINLGQEEIHLPLVKDGKDVPIAQIIFEFYNNVNFKVVDNLEETQRGEGGFGSSDKKFNITEKKSESLKENSNLIDKWKKTGASENPIPPKYETMVREREKQIS